MELDHITIEKIRGLGYSTLKTMVNSELLNSDCVEIPFGVYTESTPKARLEDLKEKFQEDGYSARILERLCGFGRGKIAKYETYLKIEGKKK